MIYQPRSTFFCLVTFRILNIGLDKTTFSTSTELINLNTPRLLHQISSVFSTVEVKSQTNCSVRVTHLSSQSDPVTLLWPYLVSSSNVFFFPVNMDPLSNVWTLLLQGHQHITCLVVKTFRREVNWIEMVKRETLNTENRNNVYFFAFSPFSELS